MSIHDDLASWPSFHALLVGYIDRLSNLPVEESEKAQLVKNVFSAKEHPQQAAHFAVLELAASQCDASAKATLERKFTDALPSSRFVWAEDDDARLFDVMVELAAYGWLCREYPRAEIEYVPQADKKTPDIKVRLDDGDVGVECKNIHMSQEAQAALQTAETISGTSDGSPSEAFVRKLEDTMTRAHAQLDGYDSKLIFLNYTPDPDLWVLEEVNPQAVEDMFRSNVPAGARLIVFRNYDWTNPPFGFEP